jgi:hypothetical protein
MASTTRSSNGRSKQAGTRAAATNRSAAANRSSASRAQRGNGNGATRSSRTGATRRSRNRATAKVSRATSTIGSAAKKAKTPLVAGGAAAAGLATGTALGALLRGSRRPKVLGVPMPRADEMKTGAKKAARAGRWLYDMETDLRLLREHAEHSRRQSPIEVLLSGLTSRSLPRGR